MKFDPQWISAIATSFGCIALALIVWQVKVNHDKCRREKAIAIIIEFVKLVASKGMYRHQGFVNDLPKPDVKKINEVKKISVNRDLVERWFPELIENNTKQRIDFDVKFVLDIRNNMIRLFNSFEIVALAYIHGVVDKRIVNECFREYLITKGFLARCSELMADFGGGWPSINEMARQMQQSSGIRKPPA